MRLIITLHEAEKLYKDWVQLESSEDRVSFLLQHSIKRVDLEGDGQSIILLTAYFMRRGRNILKNPLTNAN